MANDQDHVAKQNMAGVDIGRNMPSTSLPAMSSEEEVVADLDEPPEPSRTPRPAPLAPRDSSFAKSKPTVDRKESLLTSALKSNSSTSSPIDDQSDRSPVRGMSCVSTCSNTSSCTTAELTSDGGFTSPGTRTTTPSPPLPSTMFHGMGSTIQKKPFELPISVKLRAGDTLGHVQNSPLPSNPEKQVEAALGRKRCIMFACGQKEEKKTSSEAPANPTPGPPSEEPPKRACTIKFACPTKISTDAPSKEGSSRARMASPAPLARVKMTSPKLPSKVHRDSDSTVRNNSPVSVRKAPTVDRTRRLSSNSDLARCEAYRFHEFASSEEEIEEWTQEVTCHRNRLTVQDTLKIENNLRKLGEEVAEEEALEDDEDEDDEDVVDMDDDDELLDDDDEDSDAYSDKTDEGFQTDDEEGFAVSDDESDAGSDYNWWVPGASTAATSIEHLEQLRLKVHRTLSESSIGSLESRDGHLKISDVPSKRRKSRPVNIRVPSPELPDSTDFVCGTLDEDRPAEAMYMATLERRRAAKHKPTPQDIDPTFPTSDPELPDDDEDEVSEVENLASESDFLHGRMDPLDADLRGRRKALPVKRSPLPSPKRLRSPPPMKRAVHRSPPPPTKRSAHRSPPPRKLFGTSPRRQHSPPPTRLRSPPPTRRGSVNPVAMRQRGDMSIRFAGLAERPAPTVSASVPRTPITMRNPFELDEEETNADDMPIRRAIDIQVGLEKKRQRRRERLYRKQHCKAVKEKRPAPGRGAERMREMGLAAHAHKGRTTAFGPFQIPTAADQQDMHVLSV
ncbi:hypothetical protein IAQ61_009608 [Plenodomus lingam]|uniref:Uncharacterized protein n=1 Tax=Leptosphaeria maculans (strain JN3 / isolate v23.1.3 / race Av1-4-5-6-7-8) TaxID=985895 RepID=E4ZSW4_LEPMJ|nr:hypothetical protein LEMA_P120430.1 [Plenodomus lingam JN3]KAH9863331.1 hypothetical protein IAQ61_009608 [Plenodomus lingam]CBX94552.1 hypothetical protein LEMA_P120430.1 [Plenodomus lingam JN3]